VEGYEIVIQYRLLQYLFTIDVKFCFIYLQHYNKCSTRPPSAHMPAFSHAHHWSMDTSVTYCQMLYAVPDI